MVEVVRARAEHEDQVLELAARSLGWGTDARFRDLYRWKHDQSPLGASPRWVALDDGQVVGLRVLLPWRFRRGEGTVDAVRAVDTATDPAYQGRGIFRALTLHAVAELTASGTAFVFNTPNDKSGAGYLKMGWTKLGHPPVAITPRLRSGLRIARSNTAADRWSIPTDVGTSAPAWLGSSATDGTVLALVDASFARHRGTWSTDVTLPWLRWRYGFDHLAYRVLQTRDVRRASSSDGAAIFRLRRRGNSVEAVIADVLAANDAEADVLVRGILAETGADYALRAGRTRLGIPPSLSLPALSPLVAWRGLAANTPSTLAEFSFQVGDLELF